MGGISGKITRTARGCGTWGKMGPECDERGKNEI